MIYLITGLPGSSKTLHTIQRICEDANLNNRPVYQRGIKELTLDWNTLEDPSLWYECPDNSVIIIDEAQEVFPPRGPGKAIPPSVERFSVHRHKGYDIFIITQHPYLIDSMIRHLVETHYHYQRVFGSSMVTELTFIKAQNPDDYHARKNAQKKVGKLPKKYFDVYKSAEVHTHKIKIPMKLWLLLGLIIGVGALFFFIYSSWDNRLSDEQTPPDREPVRGNSYEQTSIAGQDRYPEAVPGIYDYAEPEPDPEPFAEYQPRVAGLPHTAPAYDELREPVTYPRPQCIANGDRSRCTCYTQQATRIKTITRATCLDILDNGLFDPALGVASASAGFSRTAQPQKENNND